MKIGLKFHEVMEGTVQRDGERFDRPFRFEFEVVADSALGMLTSVVGHAVGHVRLDGLARHGAAKGHLEMSPLLRGSMRYVFEFAGDDGQTYRFDGAKRIGGVHYLRSWTTLPGKVFNPDGSVYGKAELRFHMRRDFVDLVRSMRLIAGGRQALHA